MALRIAAIDVGLVPLAGIEPALLAELDFESSASTNSATGALERGALQDGCGLYGATLCRQPEYRPPCGVMCIAPAAVCL
jgi:hypothetical protein